MTQIVEPMQLVQNEPMIPQLNPNYNIMNSVSLPPAMIPPPLNLQLNGNFPMNLPNQIPNNNNINNNQNNQQNNIDQSK